MNGHQHRVQISIPCSSDEVLKLRETPTKKNAIVLKAVQRSGSPFEGAISGLPERQFLPHQQISPLLA
ncbi:MAG: hypothetical protein CMJ72_08855 [Planctomycetaceae bacterium]|nr:hypothetical protein [Planctomycetaceae bacterium]